MPTCVHGILHPKARTGDLFDLWPHRCYCRCCEKWLGPLEKYWAEDVKKGLV